MSAAEAAAAAAAANIPPPAANVIGLAIADFVISVLLLPVSIWVTWKHGRLGTVCWPIFITFFLSRWVDDLYLLIERHEPLVPGALNICMQAAAICCLLLGLLGAVYEANLILPTRNRKLFLIGDHWVTKVTMAVINLVNTAGIAMATYGTSPSATGAEGVQNKLIGEIGNILLLLALGGIIAWFWPTWQRIRAHADHPNALYARWLLFAAMAATPFQVVRTVYNAVHAFTLDRSLDPIFGTFATKVVFLFLMHFIVAIILLVGGWMTMGVLKLDEVELLDGTRNSDSAAEDGIRK